MIYGIDSSKKSPGISKYDNNGNLLDILYLTYNTKGRDLDVWTNIHIEESDLMPSGKSIKEELKCRWRGTRYIWSRMAHFFEDVDLIVYEGNAIAGKGKVVDLAQVVGVYIGNILSRFDSEVLEYTPNHIKKEFTGCGSSGKAQVRFAITKNYPEMESKLMEMETVGKIKRYACPNEDVCDSIMLVEVFFKKLKAGNEEEVEIMETINKKLNKAQKE